MLLTDHAVFNSLPVKWYSTVRTSSCCEASRLVHSITSCNTGNKRHSVQSRLVHTTGTVVGDSSIATCLVASRRASPARFGCMRSTAGTADRATQSANTHQRKLSYTAYEGNSWETTFDHSGVTVLVDPWLEGDLVFANQTWLYRGQKGALKDVHLDIDVIGAHADVILLSQGLDDHAHKPTLERLPKDKQVVGSPAAAAVCQSLGFTNVVSLDHGETVSVCNGRLQITGTAGALVGPPWSKRENGFVISETHTQGIKLYYEPHCDYDEEAIARIGKVDAVVTPLNSQVLVTFPLVKGKQNALKLIQTLQPSVVIPLINAQFHSSGPLSKLIHTEGSPEELQGLLQQHGLDGVMVKIPAPPGKAFDVTL